MGFFKRNDPAKVVDDTREVATDFTCRRPFWSYRTAPYRPYAPLEGLKPELDRHLEALFAGAVDEGNGDVLDYPIFDNVRLAREDLNRQRIEHHDAIVQFGVRAAGDRQAFEDQLAALETDIERLRGEQAFLQTLRNNRECKEGIL